MADNHKFRIFYDAGVEWAVDNFADLRSFRFDRAGLDKKTRDAFNWEGFIETVFRSSARTYQLCIQYQSLAEEQFVAGVCDTVCGDQSVT